MEKLKTNVPTSANVPNRIRPRCPQCSSAMDPLYRLGARGNAFVKVPDTFHCPQHDVVARGRRTTRFLA